MTTEVNRKSPVFAEGTIHIDAPAARVWAVLTDFANWPTWQAEVSAVTIDGDPAPGVTFKWMSGPGTIRSTIIDFEAPTAVVWSGKTIAIKAMHAWQLVEADGVTTVSTQESWHGPVVRIMRRSLQPALQKALDSGLLELKAEVERP
jgi:uncharacterized protein YndB with AHSA1/START domain